ncbi:hypothetical protein FRC04_003632 [Tulasnella sp. 424]|nr:hypothetical protein FRC04_003632 [Tulasnella sp. 424]KAG8965499.1 hypothetical protein FRC05_003232 [Tulasnella sp. 425]
MMELLKRFEDDSREDDLARSDAEHENAVDGSDGEDDLASKLEGIDLDSADPDFILSLLSDSQREAFLKTVQDPNGERAQELLASDEIHESLVLPWWTTPAVGDDHPPPASGRRFGPEPEMLELPQTLLDNAPPSKVSLLHNVFALIIAYAAATRSVGTSPIASSIPYDAIMAEDITSKAAPFLTNPKSTTVFVGVDSAWTDVVSRLDDASRSTLRLLLHDAETLLRPSLVSERDKPNPLHGSPFRNALLALSDIHSLYSGRSRSGTKPSKAVQRKLEFYASHVYASKPIEWELMLAVIQKKLNDFRGDEGVEEGVTVKPNVRGSGPLIEEL